MKRRKSILTLGLILTSCTSIYGQYEGLNPRHWFPLELGNYWHYHFNSVGQETDYILTTDRDTLLDGKRWVHFKEVACEGWSCGRDIWYHFTADHYLFLRVRLDSPVHIDWNTIPRSVFTVTISSDTTLREIDPVSGTPYDYPFPIILQENDFGQAADTTHLSLVIGSGLFIETYTYNLGLISRRTGDNLDLVGAYVNGRFWGDTSWISTVVGTEEEPIHKSFEVEIYPNPIHRDAHLRVETEAGGAIQFLIVNSLGQVVYQEEKQLLPGHHRQQLALEHLPAGFYLLRVQHRSDVITRKLLLIK